MTARDISRSALTTLLALVPRDTEIQVWPIEWSSDGPATLHKTLEHLGRETINAILIDAGILTLKNHELTVKSRDSLLSAAVIMTLLVDESNKSKKAAGKQHRDVIKIKAIPVNLLNSEKSTTKLSKLFCCKKNRLSRSFRHGE